MREPVCARSEKLTPRLHCSVRKARCHGDACYSPLTLALDFERVEARGLVKMFGATRALGGLDATFEAGRVSVIEGPNGSGKTTLLSILAQLARPTRGEVRYGALRATRGGE